LISCKIKLLAWLVCFNRSLCIYISVLFSLLIHLRSGLDQSILNSFEDLGLCLMLLGLILGIFCILFLLNESLALILHGLALCSYNLMQPKTKNHHFIFANYIMNMGCIWEAHTIWEPLRFKIVIGKAKICQRKNAFMKEDIFSILKKAN
jgi:uncharacterized membrane protein